MNGSLLSSVFSYIDPTTTSTLLYVLIGVGATLAFALRGVFYRLRDALQQSKVKSDNRAYGGHNDLVIYSEGRQYWSVFQTVIEELEAMGIASLYVSSDETDPGLAHKSDLTTTRYVSQTFTPAYLNNLRAEMVVMTTPQLQILTIKRSRHVKHYAHLVHAPTDLFTYRKFAFDYFDSVLCAGPHQIKSARFLEKKRNRSAKRLLETGVTYYDVMLRNLPENVAVEGEGRRPVVLLAPTWKPYGILNRFGADFIKKLLAADVSVIVRPHPQSFISFPELIGEIEQEFASNEAVIFDRAASGVESMAKSDMMISELSGIIYDYAFLYKKPVLIFDADPDLRGFEATDFDYPMWEIAVRDRVGRVITEADVANLDTHVKEVLADKSQRARIEELQRESIYNFGSAGKVAAQQIAEILAECKSGKSESIEPSKSVGKGSQE